jgi:SAM-dependent methyltransferase
MEKDFSKQVADGERFEFGANWKAFLKTLTDERINVAEDSLAEMLAGHPAAGQTFLDIGCGSGLFSLAARRLGYAVHSFDFDKQSVACTIWLKEKYFPGDEKWIIEEGSVLNTAFLSGLGKFDVVYSWGVLHHTGQMWVALNNTAAMVKEGGKLFIAVYNDQGLRSTIWLFIKRMYNANGFSRVVVKSIFIPYFIITSFCWDMLSLKNPLRRYRAYQKLRGMSLVTDWIDWLGGYPFEVSAPKKIIDLYNAKGFVLDKIKSTKRLGCNEFVFIFTGEKMR